MVIYIGNSSSIKVVSKDTFQLKVTSDKIVTLKDVLHVPDIRKNLVSGALLSKDWFKKVFESDKFILHKNYLFIGKGYSISGTFKLNVENEIVSTYIAESFEYGIKDSYEFQTY